jgi:hypothetical protein
MPSPKFNMIGYLLLHRALFKLTLCVAIMKAKSDDGELVRVVVQGVIGHMVNTASIMFFAVPMRWRSCPQSVVTLILLASNPITIFIDWYLIMYVYLRYYDTDELRQSMARYHLTATATNSRRVSEDEWAWHARQYEHLRHGGSPFDMCV